MNYCAECGHKLTIENNKLICKNCNRVYEEYNITQNEYMCLNCGAEFISDKPSLNICPYCNSKDFMLTELSDDRGVNAIIKFNTINKDFINKYKRVLRRKAFVPNIFYKKQTIEDITSVYLPYYLCNMTAEAQLLIDTNKVEKWMSNNYKYKKIDEYILLRHFKSDIKGIPILISDKFDTSKIDPIINYDFKKLEKYNKYQINNYVYENFKAKFQVEKLRKVVEDTFIKNVFAKIKDYDTVELNKIKTAVDTFEYIKVLLPIWILNVDYKNKQYYFVMNGQTGDIYYNLPRSKVKMIVIFIIIFIVIFLSFVLLRGLV